MSGPARRDLAELGLLGAIWGGSFLLMRVAAPEFGPLALIELRVAIAAAVLAAAAAACGELRALRRHAGPLLLVGAINSAIPFALFAFATLTLPAGDAAVLNSTAPLFAALVALLWLRERLARPQALGLLLGFAGVVLLVWPKLALDADRLAIGAGLLAALGYGIAAHYSKRRLAGVAPLAISAGSQIGASLLLLPFAVWAWPDAPPSTTAWLCAAALGVLCTGLAYLLYFRLIARLGAGRALAVTYLIPAFGMLWGFLFLGEPITPGMLLGGAVVLLGIALVTRSRGPRPLPAGAASNDASPPANTMPRLRTSSLPVAAVPAAAPADAAAHFERLSHFETDCSDVHASMAQQPTGFVLLDVRSPQAYAQGHVPGAVNLPHGRIVARNLAAYPPDTLFVVYCNGPHCNGADRAALALARLGRPVKKMIGGVTGWLDEGFRLTPPQPQPALNAGAAGCCASAP